MILMPLACRIMFSVLACPFWGSATEFSSWRLRSAARCARHPCGNTAPGSSSGRTRGHPLSSTACPIASRSGCRMETSSFSRQMDSRLSPEATPARSPQSRSSISSESSFIRKSSTLPWATISSAIPSAVARIREVIGDGRAVCGLSGGIDSAVAATLVHRAIGDRLTPIFVDNGLLRAGEAEEVLRVFRDHLGMHVVHVDASVRFLDQLRGIEDPEEKRRRIGHEFITIFEEEARRLGDIQFLVQGTLYPDVIESATPEASKSAARIKTHHNVGGLPPHLRFTLIEPLRYLFKDEVRQIGLQLGLPESVVFRQPFPGPGLAVRILGEVTREKLDQLRAADAIVREEIERAGLGRETWQAFAVLTPLRTVGVMGDGRTYQNLVVVRAVTSEDAMTADWARLPYDVLARISTRIVNEVPGVNRVAYDITSKPPATIEWE